MIEAPPPPRSPWQALYGAAHRLRRRWYRHRALRLPRPVVSVGNLHWGGTGKTPLVAALAAHLRDAGLAVTILSRGYRGRGRGVRVVSTGEGPLLGPKVAGDEPVLLAGVLPGVGVVVGADRHLAGRHALERLDPAPDLFLLDDGFSHLRLARDLDLLVFPADDPFGGGRLPPGGRLREPLAAAARADAVLLSGGGEGEGEELAAALGRYGYHGPGFSSPVEVLPARLEDGRELAAGDSVLLVTGIARPRRVREAAVRQGVRLAGVIELPDHHPYPAATLERIRAEAAALGVGKVLTTAKDRVKLLGRLELPTAVLPVRAVPEPAFWRWLESRLAAHSEAPA